MVSIRHPRIFPQVNILGFTSSFFDVNQQSFDPELDFEYWWMVVRWDEPPIVILSDQFGFVSLVWNLKHLHDPWGKNGTAKANIIDFQSRHVPVHQRWTFPGCLWFLYRFSCWRSPFFPGSGPSNTSSIFYGVLLGNPQIVGFLVGWKPHNTSYFGVKLLEFWMGSDRFRCVWVPFGPDSMCFMLPSTDRDHPKAVRVSAIWSHWSAGKAMKMEKNW